MKMNRILAAAMAVVMAATCVVPAGAQSTGPETHVWKTKTKGTFAHLEETALSLKRKDSEVASVPISQISEIFVTTKGNRPVAGAMNRWSNNGLQNAAGAGRGAGFVLALVVGGLVAMAPFTAIQTKEFTVHIRFDRGDGLRELRIEMEKREATALVEQLRARVEAREKAAEANVR